MKLSTGQVLGHFEIKGPLGAGGMGEVYRATDTRLGRDIAIKVLPDTFSRDPNRLARFEREARTLGSVNHPNVAVLYGLEHDPESGTSFLAMELVEGDDLAGRIARGPLSIVETLKLGIQTANGLEAAHLKGIVHRDLKPGNIRITADGTVKILDFGLAKEHGPAPDDVDFTQSPTVTGDMTVAGTILGTAPYLSPEQASGKAVDRRTDIWALGCVLYEMLTGRRAFSGATSTEILARVLEREPDWDALPSTVSPALCRLLERCLAKEPQRRLRDAGDVALALEDLEATGPSNVPDEPSPSTAGMRIALGLSAALIAILGFFVWTGHRPDAISEPTGPIRFSETSPAALDIARIGHMGSAVAISPDGHVLVWVGANGDETQLFSRHLDEPESGLIEGTEGALAPFFSPDGEWIGFWADKKIKKIAVRGGVPQTICDVDHIHGASWGDRMIVLEQSGAGFLNTIDPVTGEMEASPISGGSDFLPAYPDVLPGSKTAIVSGMNGRHIGLFSLDTGEITPLLAEGGNATYIPTGHLLWTWEDNLLAAPFDAAKLQLTGDAQTVVEGVLAETGFAAHYAVSDEGTLVYLPGTTVAGAAQPSWLRLDGTTEPLPVRAEPSFLSPRVSPDGRKVLISHTADLHHVSLIDLDRGTTTPVTPDRGNQYWAVWTPDSRSFIFNWLLGPELDLWIRPIDLSQPPRRLTTASRLLHVPMDMTPDGGSVLVGVADGLNGIIGLHIFRIDGDGTTEPLLTGDTHFIQAKVSPDGGLIAYASDQTGRLEVSIQPFPGLGATVRVSPNGGQEPLWSPSGDRIYYRSLTGRQIYAVELLDRDSLQLGKEMLLFEGDFAPGISWGRTWDIHPDGERFLVLKLESSESPKGIRVVRNWFAELERLVPTKGH